MVTRLTDPQLNKWLYQRPIPLNPSLWNGIGGCWNPSSGITGSELKDLSGLGNHLTLSGTGATVPTWTVADKLGQVLNYDGSSEYIVGNNPDVGEGAGYPFTMAIWVKPTANNVFQVPLQIANTGSGSQYHELELRSDGVVRAVSRSGTPNFAESGTYSANEWVFIVGVFNSTTSRLCYNNGVVGAEGTDSEAPSGFDVINIGRQGDSSPDGYTGGDIGLCTVWSRALFPSEITHLYFDPYAMFRTRQFIAKAPAVVGGVPLRTLSLLGCGI